MARSEQKLKLLYLLKILNENTDEQHYISMNDILSKLTDVYHIAAERKSIYDDFRALESFGIECDYSRNKGYKLKNHIFELAELKLLVDAVQSSKFITESKSTELIQKLEALTSKHKASELTNSVVIHDRIKNMSDSIYTSVDTIHDAIYNRMQITFKYFDWDMYKKKVYRHGGATYQVSPAALVWDSENYYLIAYDSSAEKIKHYRVDKMTDIVSCGEKSVGFDKDGKKFNIAAYSKKIFGMFGGDETSVVLKCTPEKAGAIIDKFGSNCFITTYGTYFTVMPKVAISPLFFAWVFEFDGEIEILEPQDVKEKYKNMLKRALDAAN